MAEADLDSDSDDEMFDEWDIYKYDEYRQMYTDYFDGMESGTLDYRKMGARLKQIQQYQQSLRNGVEEVLYPDIQLLVSQVPLYFEFLEYMSSVIQFRNFNQQLQGPNGDNEYVYKDEYDRLFDSRPDIFNKVIAPILKRFGSSDVMDPVAITELDRDIITVLRDVFQVKRDSSELGVYDPPYRPVKPKRKLIVPNALKKKGATYNYKLLVPSSRQTQMKMLADGYLMNDLRYELFLADQKVCLKVLSQLDRLVNALIREERFKNAREMRQVQRSRFEKSYSNILKRHEKERFTKELDPRTVPDEFHLFDMTNAQLKKEPSKREIIYWKYRLLAMIGSNTISIEYWERIRVWIASPHKTIPLSERQERILEFIVRGSKRSIAYLGTLNFYDQNKKNVVSIDDYLELYRCRHLLIEILDLLDRRSDVFTYGNDNRLKAIISDNSLLATYVNVFELRGFIEEDKLKWDSGYHLFSALNQEYATEWLLQQAGIINTEQVDFSVNMNDYLLEYEDKTLGQIKLKLLRKFPRISGDTLDKIAAVAKQEFEDYLINQYAQEGAKRLQLVPYKPVDMDAVKLEIGRMFTGLIPDDILSIIAVTAFSYLQEQGIMCKVCSTVTTVECCNKNPYCSPVCQKVDWINHKNAHK